MTGCITTPRIDVDITKIDEFVKIRIHQVLCVKFYVLS